MGAFAAVSLASSIATTPASAIDAQLSNGYFATTSSATTSTSTLLAAKVVKEGIYREYEIDLPDEQQLDDAKSTFKSAKETKSKKGTFLVVCVVCDEMLSCFCVLYVNYLVACDAQHTSRSIASARQVHGIAFHSCSGILHHSHGAIFLVCS